MNRVSSAVSAPVRTAAQLGVGYALVEFVAAFWGGSWDERQYLAALGLATLLVTGVQHLIENRTGRALLRDVPPTTAPVPGDAGHTDVVFLLGITGAVACGVILAVLVLRAVG